MKFVDLKVGMKVRLNQATVGAKCAPDYHDVGHEFIVKSWDEHHKGKRHEDDLTVVQFEGGFNTYIDYIDICEDQPKSELKQFIESETRNVVLTKRETFAAMALQGILMNSTPISAPEDRVKYAVIHADALIAELEK